MPLGSIAAAGVLEGGWTPLVACLGAVATMAVTKREWAALAAGFAAAGIASAVL